SNPELSFQDEMGKELQKATAVMDKQTGVCSAAVETGKLPDGLYNVVINYRCLQNGKTPKAIREDLTLGVRNGPQRPGKFTVEIEDKAYKVADAADITVKVFDRKGKLMPAARVAFKVDKGELDSDADITDSSGEVFITTTYDEPASVM